MSDDILNDPSLKKAADTVKAAFGDDFGGLMKNEKLMNNLKLRLTEADKQKIAALLKNPALLKAFLADPKAKEGIANFLKANKE